MAPKKKGSSKPKETAEEPKKEEPKKEEPKEEPKKEEAKKEEPKEEPKKEEPKEEVKEEAKKEDVEMKDAEPKKPKEPEPPKELEVDAVADKRPKVAADAVQFCTLDSTLNVMPTAGGKLMMALADDGLQYFVACSRCKTGVKSGRYMIEFKILEIINPADVGKVRLAGHKQLIRLGFSTAASSLFLTESADAVCFDSEGFFTADEKRTKPATKFIQGQTVALLLNLDAASPNADTISLFVNGVRACEPQKLPDGLKGKALYPTVNYRNVTLQVNFGPTPVTPLPFSCTMLAGAAKADTETSSAVEPKQGAIMYPVGLPGQGALDWVDDFVEKNPGYVELSDRKIVEWARKSGVTQPRIEDFSAGQLISAVAPVLKRNYVLVDLKSNLLPAEREKALKQFPSSSFKKVASVLMGEPSAQYKEKVKSLLLAAKTKRAEAELKRKKAEAERKKLAAERVKKAEAAKKARLAEAAKKKNGEEAAEEKPEEKDEEPPVEEEEMKMDPVELDEAELKLWYRPSASVDISPAVLGKVFTKFALPETSEGFAEVTYPWQPAAKCTEILKEYVLEKKMTVRVDDLTPGDWFKSQFKDYNSSLASWKKRQNDWKNPALKKKLLAEKAAAKKKEDGEAKEGEEKKEEEKKEEEPEPMKIDAEDLNPLEAEDVTDIGNGEPLFINFGYEDWAMVSLRTELHLLVHAFKKDMDDPERTGFHESHAGFYFQKYIKKPLDVKHYGKSNMADVVKLLPEVVSINSSGIFEALLPEDTSLTEFVKLAEEHRRDRQRRVDAGDETAELKFVKPGPQQPQGRPPYQQAPKRPYPGGKPSWQANKHAKISPYQPVGGFRR